MDGAEPWCTYQFTLRLHEGDPSSISIFQLTLDARLVPASATVNMLTFKLSLIFGGCRLS